MRRYAPRPIDGVVLGGIPEEAGLVQAARAALDGHRSGIGRLLPFLGPAFIACVAYIDPGNFATNIQGGSAFGYKLLWVIVLANVMAILIQTLSAKLGIATGQNLAELCGERFPLPAVYVMWVVSEVGAMATDLAEFLGASIGLNLLLHIPLLPATAITGVATYGILVLQRYGARPIEAIITTLVAVIAGCYVIETLFAQPAWDQVAYHSVVPWLGSGSIFLAVGIVGATVMPHVVYLHSALMQDRVVPRSESEARRIFHFTIPDIVIAMVVAGLINMAMLIAASTFFKHNMTNIVDIPSAYHTLTPLLGPTAGVVFAVSLLASGLSSSTVGTMAGQVIMQGFVGFTIPIALRRLITMVPAFIVVLLGINPTQSLIVSQVVLSLVLPLPVITLTYFTRQREVMGSLVNHPATTFIASVCAVVICALNLLLLINTFGIRIPGL